MVLFLGQEAVPWMDHDEVMDRVVTPRIEGPFQNREVDLERGTWTMPQDAAGGHLFLKLGVGQKIGV